MATSCSSTRIPQDTGRGETGKAKTPLAAARACEGGAAQSETCGSVAVLTLVGSTLTVEILPVVNEGIHDKDRFPAGDGLTLSDGVRLAVRPADSTRVIYGLLLCCLR